MKKIKFIHSSDLHIGFTTHGRLNPATRMNTRLEDLMKSLDFMIDYAIQREVDLILITGDIFHRSHPTPLEQYVFAERIRRLSREGIEVVMIIGNHDVTLDGTGSSALDIFSALDIPHVTLVKKPMIVMKGIVQIACLPWTGIGNLMTKEEFRDLGATERRLEFERRLIAVINNLASQLNPKFPSILAGHFAVAGSVLSGTESTTLAGTEPQIPLPELVNPAFQYVALGHIHKHQDLNAGFFPSVIYAGSLERIDFSEEGQPKGFMYAEIIDGTAENAAAPWFCPRWFVETPARSFLTIHLQETGLPETIPGDEIDGAIVRIRYEIADPDKQPDERALRAMYSRAFSVKIEKVMKRQKAQPRHEVEKNATPIDALKKYLETKPELSGIAEKMKEYAQKLISETDTEL